MNETTTRLRWVAALVAVALTASACSGSPAPAPQATASAPSTVDEGLDLCELLDSGERDELVGQTLEYPNGPEDPTYTEGSCRWRDAGWDEWTMSLQMTGMHASAWAKDLPLILGEALSGPEQREEYEDLVDIEGQLEEISDADACALWVEVNARYATAPDDDVAVHRYDSATYLEGDPLYGVRAQVCRDGVLGELTLESVAPVSDGRVDAMVRQVETVWERARDGLPPTDPEGTAA